MRKVIARKGTRRKPDEKSLPQSPTNSVGTDGTDVSKRKVSEGEAVLTAKNYRLAKELSELRVRHREETKNVTRLTMENMNLASRCREAISHVAMLKKELAMHQRRAAEALALHRQQQPIGQMVAQNVASSTSSDNALVSTTDVMAEMDRMDRLMAEHAPPPPPPNPPAKLATPPKNPPRQDDESPKSEFFSDFDEEPKNGSPSSSEESEDEMGPEVGFTKEFPINASPRTPSKAADYNEGFPDDLPRSARKKASSYLPSAPEISEVESDTNSVSSNQSDYRQTIMSSIDAFEASFSTNFPESFSSSPKEERSTLSEIYNPFFPSPRSDTQESSQPLPAETSKSKSAPLMPRSYDQPGIKPSVILPRETLEKDIMNTLSVQPVSSGIASITDEFKPSAFVPHTPPKAARESNPLIAGSSISEDEKKDPRTPTSLICRKVGGGEYDEPPRPEKRPSATARARYEKALQSRTFQIGSRVNGSKLIKSEDENSEDSDSNKRPLEQKVSHSAKSKGDTPSTPVITSANQVLERLKQRRVNSPSVSSVVRNPSPSPLKSSSQKAESPQVFKHLSGGVFSKTQPMSSRVNADLVVDKVTQEASLAERGVVSGDDSPSVSSAITAFEQVAKRNEVLNISRPRAGKQLRSSSFGEPSPIRPSSPGLPFDEDESPIRHHRSSRIQISNDDYSERPNYARATSSRGWESSSKRFDENIDVERENLASRNKRASDFQVAKGEQHPAYIGHSSMTNEMTSGVVGRNSLRNVTKPLSYAEPALNSKLRQGDVFFPKNDSDKRSHEKDFQKEYVAPVRL